MNEKSNEKVIPTQDYVLIEQLPPGKTPGGIIVPETMKNELPRCRILDVGPGVMVNGVFVKARHKAGEIVMADCRNGYNIKRGVALIREDAIVARIEAIDADDDAPAPTSESGATLQ